MIGRTHSMENFDTVDGPGTCMVIFLSGCPMRCFYCRNPDTQDLKGGTPVTVEGVLNQYEQTRPFYKRGGIMVSGGKPLMQIGLVTELFEKAKRRGMHTCLNVSGIIFDPGSWTIMAHFDRSLASTDLTPLNIKHTDPKEYVKLCSQPQDSILTFAKYLGKRRIPVWIRHAVAPGITDREEYPCRPGRYLDMFKSVKVLGVSPYRDIGKVKYHQPGIPYPLEDTAPLPSAEVAEA